ncbi:hypothetical protein MasN3_42530 [Massilia varians]|uniref:NnrU domain-containing protein n=1 Tax=Massilia varians TaxID=457921 RepID=A0ABM8CBT1_9BURK|nr:NnrU family protein [Massilia varians]BDT60759.1 hypothetical protein MasN3_42530 [Massilia varians]
MDASMLLMAFSGAFVGTHFLLSHPWRRPLVKAMGDKGFLALYSLVAFATLGGMAWASPRTPAGAPLWQVGDALWALATIP